MDSDLSESISALKHALEEMGANATFGHADRALVDELDDKLDLPRRYREFLLACNPIEAESVTPSERIRLLSAQELLEEQKGFALGEHGARISSTSPDGWRSTWIIVAISSLLGDPYFLDVAHVDTEGDCPVFSAMSGTDMWQPRLCASSFAMFLRTLAVTMEVARGFDVDSYDSDDEHVFREAIGPRIREHDPAAAKAGHWT